MTTRPLSGPFHFTSNAHERPTDRAAGTPDPRLSLPREDLEEILREAGLPLTFALDWLLDRLEPPPPHGGP